MSREVIFKPLAAGNKHPWSRDEMKFLLANHTEMYIEDIAKHLGRAIKATKNKAFRMGCSIKSKPKGNIQ